MESPSIAMAYGRTLYSLTLPPGLKTRDVFSPEDHPPLPDPAAALESAFSAPIGAPPPREVFGPADRVVIATSDNTRPVPNRELIEALVRHLGLTAERVTILVGGGSHQGNTREEWVEMFGEEIVSGFPIVNHDAYDEKECREVGRTAAGGKALLNRRWLDADKRIVLGFIEPHFFAGFSGGAKGIMPALAGIETILHFHRAEIIGHPDATWGRLEGNPQQALAREIAAMAPPDFLVNVTLNLQKRITGVYCGHYLQAHEAGAVQAAREAMVPVARAYPLVITTNSGYPLDQNLYQTVKGISAAAKIVEPGGTILTIAECAKGIPDHGHFAELMAEAPNPEAVLERIEQPGFAMLDQWQAQSLALILRKARVHLYSTLPDDAVRRCRIDPVADPETFVADFVREFTRRTGAPPAVALLPQGPLTIPYPAKAAGRGAATGEVHPQAGAGGG